MATAEDLKDGKNCLTTILKNIELLYYEFFINFFNIFLLIFHVCSLGIGMVYYCLKFDCLQF